MIHVFVGTDNEAKKRSLGDLLRNYNDREVLYFDSESFDQDTFLNSLSGGDMFSQKYVGVLRDLVFDKKHSIFEKIERMKESETVFVVLEETILKAGTEMLKPHASTWKALDLPKGRDEKFNIFSITDAFGARDKKSTWVMLQKALRSGVTSDEILNILIWQAKNLLITKREAIMKNTGLSLFVYEKARKYSANYTLPELETMSRSLVSMFHESHLGLETEPNLEKFLLKSL